MDCLLQVLLNLATGGGSNPEHGEAIHTHMVFCGLPGWLVPHASRDPPAKTRLPRLGWSASDNLGIAIEISRALLLRLAGSLPGLKGILGAGGTAVLVRELEAPLPPVPTGYAADFAATGVVLSREELQEARYVAASSVVKHRAFPYNP